VQQIILSVSTKTLEMELPAMQEEYIVVVISSPVVSAETEMIIFLFLHAESVRRGSSMFDKISRAMKQLNTVDNTFQHSRLIR
jgi:hypothetical protein